MAAPMQGVFPRDPSKGATLLDLPIDVKRDYGASGSAESTTGSIDSGSTTLTLTAAKDFKNGQGISVAGAGTSGALLVTSIVSGGGTTTLALKDAAGTTASGAAVLHDDTAAVKGAVAALPSTGGTIVFPVGQYNVSSALTLPDGTVLVGMGSPETSSPVFGVRVVAQASIANIFNISSSGVNLLQMHHLGLDANALATNALYLPAKINQRGMFVDCVFAGATAENVYYDGIGGNYVHFQSCYCSLGTKGFYINADWVTLQDVFVADYSDVAFHYHGGLGCVFSACHAWLGSKSATTAYQNDGGAGGQLTLLSPSIEIASSGLTLTNGFYATAGVTGPVINPLFDIASGATLSTNYNAYYPVFGVHTNYGIQENATDNTVDINYQGSLAWRVWAKLGVSRGFVLGSPSSLTGLTTSGTSIYSISAVWCKISAADLPAAGAAATFPISTNGTNNGQNQAYLLVPYSGFATVGQQVGIESQPTSTGVDIVVASYALPSSPVDIVFLIVFGV